MATASAAATGTDADSDVDADANGFGHGVVLAGRGLEKSYGAGAPVLRGVDIEVRPRERVALIGANGAGKSTLLRCLVGLEPLGAGEVTALGERFGPGIGKRAQKRIARRIGFVFQRHGLVRRASALTNVLHGMLGRPGGWRAISHVTAPGGWRADALAALGEVQLEGKALDRADRLSGGQAQRVAVARAILRRPPLLIADEPAASLDPVAGHEVMALFSRLAVEHEAALLFTSHDMDHAVAYADRVVALKGGRTLFDLPSAAVDPARLRGVFDD